MGSDVEWVEDVRRWYLSGASSPAQPDASDSREDPVALGYEAAQPALQARHWPDAPLVGTAEPL